MSSNDSWYALINLSLKFYFPKDLENPGVEFNIQFSDRAGARGGWA